MREPPRLVFGVSRAPPTTEWRRFRLPDRDPDQGTFDFNAVEITPELRERLRRIALQWTLEEADEDFKRLPGETLEEFLAERDAHLRSLEVFGPTFPKEPSVAWQLVQGLRRSAPPRVPRQLILPLDEEEP